MEMTLIPTNELESKLRGIVRAEFQEILSSLSGISSEEKPLKRDDLAEMFGVSLVTVHDWMKKGIITGYKMNGRTYFKRDEIAKSMKEIKIRKKLS